MKLLLDTHTFLWLVDGNSSLSAIAQAALCDPFDRMLIAQAEVEAMTLVSADRKFASYSSRLLW